MGKKAARFAMQAQTQYSLDHARREERLPEQLFAALTELLEHGYGRVEVVVQDNQIQIVQVTKSFK